MHQHNRFGSLRSVALLSGAAALCAAALTARAEEPPSRPAVDSPELAPLGRYAVGVRTVTLVEHDAVDVLSPGKDRPVVVDLWYPATVALGSRPETYAASLQSEPPEAAPVRFTVPGLAVRGAPAAAGRYPLVVV